MSTRIKSLRTNAGYLEGIEFRFHEGFTCVIGARGNCKSTSVETTRFVFDCDPKFVNFLLAKTDLAKADVSNPLHLGLVKASLGKGTARCVVEHDGVEYVIEREVDSAPRILKNGAEVKVPGLLSKLEVYSQGELVTLAGSAARRLDLIDRRHAAEIEELKERRRTLTIENKEAGLLRRKKKQTIATLDAEIKELGSAPDDLKELQKTRPPSPPGWEEAREAHLERQRTIRPSASQILVCATQRERLKEHAAELGDCRELVARLKKWKNPGAAELTKFFAGHLEAIDQATRALDTLMALDPTKHLDLLKASFDEEEKKYQVLQSAQDALTAATKREDALRERIASLEKKKKELNQTRKELVKLEAERAERRTAIEEITSEIFKIRESEVRSINRDFEGVIKLDLTSSAAWPDYKPTLDALLAKSKLRGQSDLAAETARSVPPPKLIELVESKNVDLLEDLLSDGDEKEREAVHDRGSAAKLITRLADHDDLYDLETLVPEDQLEIFMHLPDGPPKPIQHLSKGLLATALLPLILREADYPLIFDQPEDDLDNRFIFQTVVDKVRKLKKKRQLIFVSHNANIPVLGEADLMLVTQMADSSRAAQPLYGTVEEMEEQILSYLEGGADAFTERARRYKSLAIETKAPSSSHVSGHQNGTSSESRRSTKKERK